MIFETLAALLIGILIGIFTGIAPGIHVNLVAAGLLASSPFLLTFLEPLTLGVFILSLAVTHSFLDTIPSIYLGAPDNENALSILPGQRMLLAGEGYQAIKITITGTYIGMLLSICLIPVFMLCAKSIYPVVRPFLFYLMVTIILFMLFKEKERFWGLFLFLLSGCLGLVVFATPILKEPLFPLLSGLFGVSGLLISYFENTHIPEQKITSNIDIAPFELGKSLVGSMVAVFVVQFFPGLGPAQGAVMASQIFKDLKDKGYLALVGALGTMSVIFSLVTFYTLDKAKDGSIVVLEKLVEIDSTSFVILLLAMVLSGSIATLLVLPMARVFTRLIAKVNYRLLITSVISLVFMMCIIINGPVGVLVLITSTAIGLIAPLTGVGRSHAMGCLLLPVLFYLA